MLRSALKWLAGQYVSGLERGEFNVSVVALAKLARAAGLRLSVLFESE